MLIASVPNQVSEITVATKKAGRTILTTDKTLFAIGEKIVTLADFKEGDDIGGSFKKNKDGKEEATWIRLIKETDGKADPKKPDEKK